MNSLSVKNLTAGYGPITVIRDLSFEIAEGEACLILGSNGAGKTTTLRALSGLVSRRGTITFGGRNIIDASPDLIARLGIGHVPQDRGTFRDLSVDDNLKLGAVLRRDGAGVARDRDLVLGVFPRLRERLAQLAGHLSGGEQQILAIARALLAAPRLLLLDEPSLGLSPIMTGEVFAALGRLQSERSLAMLIVEQNAAVATGLADRCYVLQAGVIAKSGPAAAVFADPAMKAAYLGF
jgi:branched-chain amino acid transport system ATP-binding protein